MLRGVPAPKNMNRLIAIAAVLLVALVGLWVWGPFDPPAEGKGPEGFGPSPRQPETMGLEGGAAAKTVGPGPADRERLQERETAPTLLVTVFDNFDRPVQGAIVWRWRETEAGCKSPDETVKSPTDAKGRASLPGSAKPGGVVVLARNHPVLVRKLSTLSGDHEIRLQAGARVQGWIRVDGNMPAEPVVLRLYGHGARDPLAQAPGSMRPVVYPVINKGYRIVQTGAEGEFEFTGLEQDWEGGVSLPSYLWFRGESLQDGNSHMTFKLAKPQTGLQLDTTLLPGVRGRVVWDDTGQGIKTYLMVSAEFEDGEESGFYGCLTDERGYFRVGFGPAAFARRRAWANGEGRKSIRKITVNVTVAGARNLKKEFPKPASEIELRLQRANTLHFLVLDTAGKPLAGAALKGVRPTKPTGADGRGTVEVQDLGQRLFLSASPGHLVAEVEARSGVGTPESPLEFVLAKGNKLVVVLRNAGGGGFRGGYLSVRSNQPLGTGTEEGQFTYMHRFVGTPLSGANWGPGTKMDSWFQPDHRGEVVLGSLRPKVQIQLVVVDKLSQDAMVRDAVTPGEGQTERIEMCLEEEPRDLTGLVVDARDRPMPGCRIVVMFGSRGKLTRTDEQGIFRLEGGYPTGNTFTLRVSHRGYVTAKKEGLKITTDLEPIQVRLLPGSDVEVSFVDPDGVRLPVTDIRINGKRLFQNTQVLEPGLLLLKDQPPEPLVLSTQVAGRKYELRHHPAESKKARFVLPAMGRIQIHAPRPPKLEFNSYSVKVTARSDGKSLDVLFQRSPAGNPLKTRERLLLPGEYTVEVRARERAGGQLLHPPKQVRIEPGKLSLCRFGERR